MKVYVLFAEDYEDSHVCAVAETKEDADRMVDKFNNGYEVSIQEYDTELFKLALDDTKKCYLCRKDFTVSIEETDFGAANATFDVIHAYKGMFTMYTIASNFGEAEKKFLDKLDQFFDTNKSEEELIDNVNKLCRNA